MKSLPFHIPETWKRYPFGRSLPHRPSHGVPPPPPSPTSPRVVDEECSLVRHSEDAIISLLTFSECLFNFNTIWFCVSPLDCPLDPWSACWKHWVSFNCKDVAGRTKWIKAVCGPNSKKTSCLPDTEIFANVVDSSQISKCNLRFGCFSQITKFWRKFVPFMVIAIFLFNRKDHKPREFSFGNFAQ